jgi:hypothetical protein
MKKRYNTSNDLILNRIIDKIEQSTNCPKYKQLKDLIEIDTWQNIGYTMQRNKAIAEVGFGFCIPNYLEFGQTKAIIIINSQNCKKANFTESEFASIIYHELGHLLNYPELEIEPDFAYCMLHGFNYDKDYHNNVVELNNMKKEIYADSYAAKFGHGDALISTFHKQNLHFAQKIEFLEERINAIKNGVLLEGKIITE